MPSAKTLTDIIDYGILLSYLKRCILIAQLTLKHLHMKPDQLTGEELALVQKRQGGICVSVIVPTHRLSPERRADPLEVEKALTEAKAYLNQRYPENDNRPLVRSLDELYEQIDFKHNSEGVGLFVSRDIRQLVHFYFPVKEKIMISDGFETRDWIYQVYYSKPYFLLFLTENDARLYEGALDHLEEVVDKNFPRAFTEDYAYNKPSRGSSYTGNAFAKEFERDKTQLKELHYEGFLKGMDDVLDNYLVEEIPLVVTGAPQTLGFLKKITRHLHIAGELEGNYEHKPLNELGALSWELMKKFLDQEKQMLVEFWKEKVGQGQGVSGIAGCWQAAKEGRAFKLLVEKDFAVPGYLLQGDDYRLFLEPPGETYNELPDVVNTLMEIVIEKGGRVIPLENGVLANYGGVVLITRY